MISVELVENVTYIHPWFDQRLVTVFVVCNFVDGYENVHFKELTENHITDLLRPIWLVRHKGFELFANFHVPILFAFSVVPFKKD